MAPEPRPPSAGPLLVGLGALIVVVGLLVWSGALNWFGKLPGDIRYENEDGSTRFYVPWVSMLVFSAFFSGLSYLLKRLQ